VYLDHFERLRPICPVCRLAGIESFLTLGQIAHSEAGEILEGSLVCSRNACQREHPILDGIPVVLADAPSWFATQIIGILRRDDLSDFAESLLGDLGGQGTSLDRDRGNNAIYCDSHWHPQDPTYMVLFDAAMGMLTAPPTGLWLDIGCSVGRGSLELARRTHDLVVGLDLNFSMLRVAQRIRRSRQVRYQQRRVGLAFDTVSYPLPDFPVENVSYWCADVAIFPFADASFAGSISMNMLDCVQSPLGLLFETGRVTIPGAECVLCTPFDWAVGATTPGHWIGGHSQRMSPHQGSSVAELRRILATADTGLTQEAELDGLQWRLRLHERSVTEYSVYCTRLRRRS
jgi:SAM-dependent methyltransferase/uncharacterized protein YbaR (Trm112 family)